MNVHECTIEFVYQELTMKIDGEDGDNGDLDSFQL
jgi:hypothetical protein